MGFVMLLSPKILRGNEKGFALLGVLCVLVLLAVTALVMSQRAGLQSQMAANQTQAVQNHLGQVAAVEHAVSTLLQDPTWRTSLSGENYTFEGVTYNRKVLNTGSIGCSRILTVTITPPGGLRSIEASFLWHAQTLYIADTENSRVRKVDPATQIIYNVAGTGTDGYSGDGGPATSARLRKARGAATDASCNLFIADTDNHVIRKVDSATGIISTAAGTGSSGYWGDGLPATMARLNKPRGVAVAPSGNLYIADTDNNVIRRVLAATGIIETYAGTGSAGYWGDGWFANLAELNRPYDVFVDATSIYIADTDNHCIRKVVAATYRIYTVAGTGSAGYSGNGGAATSARLNKPRGVFADPSGNLYIADTDNNVIRRVLAATGVITTVAGTGSSGYTGDGGPATSANLNKPRDVYLDLAGNLYIADTENNRIRRVDAATGIIQTVAGTGSGGDSGDGGPATSAKLDKPRGLCINAPASLSSILERL